MIFKYMRYLIFLYVYTSSIIIVATTNSSIFSSEPNKIFFIILLFIQIIIINDLSTYDVIKSKSISKQNVKKQAMLFNLMEEMILTCSFIIIIFIANIKLLPIVNTMYALIMLIIQFLLFKYLYICLKNLPKKYNCYYLLVGINFTIYILFTVSNHFNININYINILYDISLTSLLKLGIFTTIVILIGNIINHDKYEI